MKKQYRDFLVFLIFCAVLVTVVSGTILGLDTDIPSRQKVKPPQLPHNVQEAKYFWRRVRYYVSEEYGFQNLLIDLHGSLYTSLFSSSPSNLVLKGKDDWLFLGGEGVLDQYRNLSPMNGTTIDNLTQALLANKKDAKSVGADYKYIIVPNKHAIYPEYLPDFVQVKKSPSDLDQLKTALVKKGQADLLIELGDSLRAAKPVERLYHKTDTHWNEAGAYYGVREIFKKLGLEGKVPALEKVRFQSQETFGGDLARLMGRKAYVKEQLITHVDDGTTRVRDLKGLPLKITTIDVPPSRVVETRNGSGVIERMLVFHDSMGLAMIDFLAEMCQHCLFIRSNEFDPLIVKEFQPDIVLQELVERRLTNDVAIRK